jgi:hypothetical protein
MAISFPRRCQRPDDIAALRWQRQFQRNCALVRFRMEMTTAASGMASLPTTPAASPGWTLAAIN